MTTATTTERKLELNAEGFAPYKHEVSKTEQGKYVPVGSITAYVPVLSAFGISAEIESVGEDGLPIYKEDKYDWLFSAILSAVKTKVRNTLQPKSIEFREGASVPTTFAELLAEGKRGGGGEALAAIRDIKTAFRAWVATLGKSAAAQKMLITQFESPKGLETQTDAVKAKIKDYLASFVDQWEDEDVLERGAKYLAQVEAAAESNMMADDF